MKKPILFFLMLLMASCTVMDTQDVRLEFRRHSYFLEGEKAAVIQPFITGLDTVTTHDLLAQIGYSLLPGKIVKAPYERMMKPGPMEKSTVYRLARQSGASYALVVTGEYSSKNIIPEKEMYPDYVAPGKRNAYARYAFIYTDVKLIRLRDLKTVDSESYDHVFQTSPIFDTGEADIWDREMALRGVSAAFRKYCEHLKGETGISVRKIFFR